MSSNTSNKRISFASTKNQLQYPDFLEVQLKVFQDFFQLDTTPENRKNEEPVYCFKENFPNHRHPEQFCSWNFWTTSSTRPVIR